MKIKRFKKDSRKRQSYKKTELFQKILKFLFLYVNDSILKLVVKKYQYYKIYNDHYKTKIKNFCVITGRSRGIFQKLKISRIIFRLLGSEGLFFGLQKAS
jgi:small subunit ribosomal protein S14